MVTYENTIINENILYGRWHEGFRDEDTGKVVSILRHEAICYSDEIPKLKKKQSRLNEDKWAVYTYDKESMEFPKLMYYLWKKNRKNVKN
jgi:hypothetical protein